MVSKKHFIVTWLEPNNFSAIFSAVKEVEITPHTEMRLKENERGIHHTQEILNFLKYRMPERVGLQANGLYALFYERNKNELVRIIAGIIGTKIFIVTFHNIDKQDIPRLK